MTDTDIDNRVWLTLTVTRRPSGDLWWCTQCSDGQSVPSQEDEKELTATRATIDGLRHMTMVHRVPIPDVIDAEDYTVACDESGAQEQLTVRFGPAYDPKVAAHVLWHLHWWGGREPGAFIKHLLEAIAAASPEEARRLRFGFAAYVDAFHLASSGQDGIAVLGAIAELAKQPQDAG